jgi:hypothetical protein
VAKPTIVRKRAIMAITSIILLQIRSIIGEAGF